MIPCWWMGRLIGALAVNTVDTQVRQYKLARPIPPSFEVSSDVDVLDDEDDELNVEVSAQATGASEQVAQATVSTPK